MERGLLLNDCNFHELAIFGGRKALRNRRFSAKKSRRLLNEQDFPGLFLAFLTVVSARAQSPYESSADFAKYAMKLRQEALLKVEPQVFIPTTSRNTISRYPWKTNIVTTVFWVGEQAGGNNPVPNVKSSWDANWSYNYGGFDNPEASARRNYIPVSFVPKQNPFYCALPYNDVTHGQFKPEAALVIPWFRQSLHAARGNPFASRIGSPFAMATAPLMRNGKTADRSARIIFSMFFKTNARDRI